MQLIRTVSAMGIFMLVMIGCLSSLTSAAVTREMAYQGKLLDDTGAPVADGDYAITLRIYDAASGGTCVWSARGSCGTPTARTVTVTNGIFSLMLGDTADGDNAIDLDFNSTLWLGVKIEADNEMTPRKKMGSAPSAINSDLLDGLNSATSGTNAHIVATNSSGDITSSGDLAVNGGDITSTGSMTFTPSAGTNLNFSLSGAGNFVVNTNHLYVDTSTGNVGIGTTSPNEKMDVRGAMFLGQTTAPSTTTDRLYNDSGKLYWNGIDLTSTAGLPSGVSGQTVRHNGTSWVASSLLFNDGTNVGIGTTSPNAKLDVRGGIAAGANGTEFVVGSGGIVTAGTWNASAISATYLVSTVMVEGENISLLNNNAGYITDGNTNWDNSYGFITSADDSVSGSELDGVFSTTGLLKRTGAATYTTITDNSSNWDAAYTHSTNDADTSATNELQNLFSNIAVSGQSDVVADATSDTLTFIGGSNVTLTTNATGDSVTIAATDTNTTYSASGTLLNLSGTTFSVNAGTLTNGKLCTFVTGTGLVCDSNDVGFANPLTAAGDIMYGGTSGTPTRLAGSGNNGYVLKYNTASSAPFWAADNDTTYSAGSGLGLNSGTFSLGGALTANTNLTGAYNFNVTQGNVGIGTTNPTEIVQVMRNVDGRVQMELRNPSDTANAYAEYRVTAGSVIGWIGATPLNFGAFGAGRTYVMSYDTATGLDLVSKSATGDIRFFSGGAYAAAQQRMVINNSGNVGVGTTSPDELLHVTGNIKSNLSLLAQGAIISGAAVSGSAVQIGDANDRILMYANSGNVYLKSNDASDLYIEPDGGDTFFSGTGNVGIGTTNPQQKLEITGNLAINNGYPSYLSLGGNTSGFNVLEATSGTLLTINKSAWANVAIPSGNVGIGTTSPNEKLDLRGVMYLGQTTAPGTTTDRLYNVTGNLFWNGTQLNGGGSLPSGTSGQTLRNNGSGWVATSTLFNNGTNIGIGTTNPTNPLEVAINSSSTYTPSIFLRNLYAGTLGTSIDIGNSTTTFGAVGATGDGSGGQLDFRTNNGTFVQNMMTIKASGNVGIGTGSPSQLLSLYSAGGTTGTNIQLTNSSALAVSNVIKQVYTFNAGVHGEFGMLETSTSTQGLADFVWSTWNGSAFAERMRLTSGGNVGMGTTAPSQKLHLASTQDVGIVYDSTSATDNIQNATFTGTSNSSNSGSVAWGTPERAELADSLEATANFGAASTYSQYLWVNDLGFDVPSGATITGVQVSIGRYENNAASNIVDREVRLVKGGTVTGNNKASASEWPTTYASVNYGSSSDLWGTTLTSADVNSSNFGVVLSIDGVNGTTIDALVDNIYIRVYYSAIKWTTGVDYSDGAKFKITNSATLGSSDRLTIDNYGDVGIGTTAPEYQLDVYATDIDYGIARFTGPGATSCSFGLTGVITCTSDASLKKNIADINYGLETVMNLHPVNYNWKFESDEDAKSLGFIAQEVEQYIPRLVSTDSKTGLKSLNTIGMVPILTKAIQDQQQQITTVSTSLNTTITNQDLLKMSTNDAIMTLGSKMDVFDQRLKTIERQDIDQQLALVESDLTSVHDQMASLSTNISNLNQFAQLATDQMTNHEQRIATLENEVKVAGVSKTYTASSAISTFDSVMKFTQDGGKLVFTIDGDLKANKVGTDELELGGNISGTGTIKATTTEIEIPAPGVTETSKIYITSKGRTFGRALFYEDIVKGTSFKVKIDGDPVENDINFNWMIVK